MSAPARTLLVLLLGLLLAACLPSEHPSLERRVLESDHAAAILMPGAEELAQFGKERGDTVTGPAFATHAYLFGTQAGDEEVIAFYDRELRRLGWAREDDAVVSGSTDRYVSGWCKPRLTYRLAMKQERAFEPSVYQGKTFRTVFDAGLVAVRAGRTCHGR